MSEADKAESNGGADRDRTDDFHNAIVALFQLSYGPIPDNQNRSKPLSLSTQLNYLDHLIIPFSSIILFFVFQHCRDFILPRRGGIILCF